MKEKVDKLTPSPVADTRVVVCCCIGVAILLLLAALVSAAAALVMKFSCSKRVTYQSDSILIILLRVD